MQSDNDAAQLEKARNTAERWGGSTSSLRLLSEGQNIVYRFEDGATGEGKILRLTPLKHRHPSDLQAELDFILYLKAEGCDVAAPLPSLQQNLLEPIGDTPAGGHAAVFEEITAPLVKWGRDDENRQTLRRLGRWIGKVHKKSLAYRPPGPMRFHWFEEALFKDPEAHLPESEPGLRDELSALIRWLNARPANAENYGLIHGDFSPVNFRIDGERVIGFDFDDCTYHWFAFDLAVALVAARRLPLKYRRPYAQCLLEGYALEKDLCGDSCREIEWFSRLSAMNRYIFALRSLDPDHPTSDQLELLAERKRNVLQPVTWC